MFKFLVRRRFTPWYESLLIDHFFCLFLQIASSSLLKLGIETEKDVKARESTYLLLDLVSINRVDMVPTGPGTPGKSWNFIIAFSVLKS